MCDSGLLLRRIIREPAIKSPVLSLLFKEDGKSVKQGVTLIFFLIRGVGTFQKVTTREDFFAGSLREITKRRAVKYRQ